MAKAKKATASKAQKATASTAKAAPGILFCISGAHTEYASVNPGDLVYADAKIATALPGSFVPVEDKVRDFGRDR